MIERLILVLLLAAMVAGAFQALRTVHGRRISRAVAGSGRTTPTLLYFHSDHCAACPAQGRMLDQLLVTWNGRLTVERIDAEQEPETASRYGVFSLPTTILIDTTGHVQQINYGLTHTTKLEQQLINLDRQLLAG